MYILTIGFAYNRFQNLYINFVSMFLTGLIGGLAFINCLYGIFSDDKIIL